MSNPFIIGITGHARSGKDTAGRAICNAFGYRKFSFADPIRRDLIALDPIVDPNTGFRLSDAMHHFDYNLEMIKEAFPEWRDLCQRYGTDVWRTIDPDIWVKRTVDAIQTDWLNNKTPGYVIPDLRFPNELKNVAFDLTIRVERPGFEAANGHEAESYIDNLSVDYTIQNDSDQLHFQERIVRLVQETIYARSGRSRA